MLFSIDIRFEKIIKFVLEIFNANLSKANHILHLSNLNTDDFTHHINIFMFIKNICIICIWNEIKHSR